MRAAITLNLLSPCTVASEASGRLRLVESEMADGRLSARGWIDYDPRTLLFSAEKLPILDRTLNRVWAGRLAGSFLLGLA